MIRTIFGMFECRATDLNDVEADFKSVCNGVISILRSYNVPEEEIEQLLVKALAESFDLKHLTDKEWNEKWGNRQG